jgi:pimeloyl-ACP methyl ester carboxylesterase
MEYLAGIGQYESFGQGPPVVVLSNPQADPGWWARPIISALTGAGYRVITFVHTGPRYAPADVADDVSAFLDHLGTEPVRLLGWSQGAAIAQEVALLRPDRVAAAALIASYGRPNTIARVLQEAWRCLDAAGPELDPIRSAMLLLTSYPAAALGDDAFLESLLPGVRQWSAGTGTVPESRQRSRAFIQNYQDRLGALAGVRVPCLVMGFAGRRYLCGLRPRSGRHHPEQQIYRGTRRRTPHARHRSGPRDRTRPAVFRRHRDRVGTRPLSDAERPAEDGIRRWTAS